MTQLKLWHIPLSRSVRVLWLLEEIGCEFELVVLDRPDASPGLTLWKALHPDDPPPALRDGEVTIHETGAMIEWLCETRAEGLWRAPGVAGRLGWLDWLHFGETILQRVSTVADREATWIQSDGAIPKTSEVEIGRLRHALTKVEQWLENSEWLLSEFSGVDCQVGYSVWLAALYGGLGDLPRLAEYRDRCAARPAFQRALLADTTHSQNRG